MSKPSMEAAAEFDAYAAEYDALLASGLSVFGEDKSYFARGRVVWLAHCLAQLRKTPRTALDFGCGIGSTTPFLLEQLKLESLVGMDVSAQSLAAARQKYAERRVRFVFARDYHPECRFDLVYCNGMFHHVAPGERERIMTVVYDSLRPGGIFAFWENNPWNPGTRYIMRRIPFDRDAVPLPPPAARGLVREVGFAVLRTDFLFFFPRFLRWLRWLEPALAPVPLGAQYQILCQKPEHGA